MPEISIPLKVRDRVDELYRMYADHLISDTEFLTSVAIVVSRQYGELVMSLRGEIQSLKTQVGQVKKE